MEKSFHFAACIWKACLFHNYHIAILVGTLCDVDWKKRSGMCHLRNLVIFFCPLRPLRAPTTIFVTTNFPDLKMWKLTGKCGNDKLFEAFFQIEMEKIGFWKSLRDVQKFWDLIILIFKKFVLQKKVHTRKFSFFTV